MIVAALTVRKVTFCNVQSQASFWANGLDSIPLSYEATVRKCLTAFYL